MNSICDNPKVRSFVRFQMYKTRAVFGQGDGAKGAGVAMVERIHGVEEVSDHAGPCFDSNDSFFVVGTGVAYADHDAVRAEVLDSFHCAG